MYIQVDLKHLNGFVRNEEMEGIAPQVKTAHHMLHNGTGMGNDYIGWLCRQTMIKKSLKGFSKRQNKFNLIRIF